MIRVISHENSERFALTLDQMFRLRHELFVKERGWKDFDKDGLYEQDRYDNEHAVYLTCLDDAEAVVGCMRLYPTTLPHMLSEHFRDFVDGEIPSSDTTIEMTRLGIRPSRRGGRTYHELLLGVLEYCLENRIQEATGLVRHARIPIAQAIGFYPEIIGPVRLVDDDPVVAVRFDMTTEALARVRRHSGIAGSVLEPESMSTRKIA
ncbi:acyl-homoserine-lactone synthase [Rhodopseudomonas pseudopalustris]|uniref:Acyl-homoserine lactone synthase n=1 Tax=Rhodopseudomonas pseudopalustris TaxID=1513892 RepID=A0A1H8RNQ1_9BRAD|nr:acyl-homoserine-lactone synthase [Rhodopseudomonas pseudopalustris]SEO68189.1 acyl-homoserine lactone synthase [Rhodopseudomonas pseudopalustris]